MNLEMIPTKCVLCGDSRSRLMVIGPDQMGKTPGEFRVVECISCGTWRIDPAPPSGQIRDLYPENYEAHTRSVIAKEAVIPGLTHRLRRNFVEWVSRGRPSAWTQPIAQVPRILAARIFSRTRWGRFNPLAFHGEGRKVLDIGCGSGDLLEQFRSHGWMAEGIEASENAARLATGRGFRVATGRFPEDAGLVRSSSPYSVISMANVLEHLSDPLGALREAYQLLEPGGFLLIWTPVADGCLQKHMPAYWYNLDIPRHLHLFTRKGLASILRQTGFEILENWPCTSARAVLRTLAIRCRASGRPKLAATLENRRWILRLANPLVRVMDLFHRGDIILVMAERPPEKMRKGEP